MTISNIKIDIFVLRNMDISFQNFLKEIKLSNKFTIIYFIKSNSESWPHTTYKQNQDRGYSLYELATYEHFGMVIKIFEKLFNKVNLYLSLSHTRAMDASKE